MTASIRNVDKVTDESTVKTTENHEESPTEEKKQDSAMTPEAQATPTEEEKQDLEIAAILSERRRALFEPLEPVNNVNGKRPSAENLLPPPDFDSASYPRGWLIGKKRKLVNVDVVESMRRIAVQEMNRKVLFQSPHLSNVLFCRMCVCGERGRGRGRLLAPNISVLMHWQPHNHVSVCLQIPTI